MFEESVFYKLKDMMERELKIEIVVEGKGENKFLIRSGDNFISDCEITEINFRFENDVLIIPIFYLSSTDEGIGTKIMQWLINFCKDKDIKAIEVKGVKQDKLGMQRLLANDEFNFYIIKHGEYMDYRMQIID